MAFSFIINAAENFDNGKIILNDGKILTGLVEIYLNNDFINFKSSENSEPKKIATETIKTIIYLEDDKKTTTVEYDRIKVYLGWKQTKISDFVWCQVVERGIATLYVINSEMQGSIYIEKAGTAGFHDYFIMRESEPAAKMIANISTANNNQTFRAKAPIYFSDFPELARKIESKEYTWKDLVPVVQEYNKWAKQNKK